MADPNKPKSGWTQPEVRRSRGRRAGFVIVTLWLALGVWVVIVGLLLFSALFAEQMQGEPYGSSTFFVQSVAISLVGLIGFGLALWWTYRRTRPS